MNPCQRFRESIFDFVDNELDILRKNELERHLKACTQCSRFLEQIHQLRSQCKQLSPITATEEFHVLLRERIRREMAGKRGALTPSIAFSARWIPAFGMMLLLIGVGFWMLDQKTSFFGSSDNRVAVSQVPTDNRREYEGEVQYVIDDYRDIISISRIEEEPVINPDSVLHETEQEYIQNRLTPVSF